MFDQLHDPDPPAATSHHLAVVAERAAHLRRRRNATVGGLAAIALLAAGTIGLAAVDRSDGGPEPLADGALPTVSPVEPVADDPAPTTTVLDPESLPPAVPVNPDPDDLPPAVPVTSDPDDVGNGSSGSDTDDGSDSGSDGSQTPQEPSDPPTDDEPVTTLDDATAAALRSADPLAAVTESGAAVWFPSLDDEPITVATVAVSLDFLADGTATVERADGTITVLAPDGTTGDAPLGGSSHAVGPDGTTVCALRDASTELACGDGDQTVSFTDVLGPGAGRDLMWLDGDTVLVIGRADAWTITIAELSSGETTTRPFASTAEFGDLRFAGRDGGGGIAVHDAGTGVVLVGASLDRFGSDWADDGTRGTSLEVRRLDEAARSFWYDGATEIVVSAGGTLTVDGVELPGTHRWARR